VRVGLINKQFEKHLWNFGQEIPVLADPISPQLTCFIFAALKHDGETEIEIRWVYDKIATPGVLLI
jgi:hypothetical protein